MKKTSLLVLPILAMLLGSCASKIKGSDLPDLSDDPGHLLKYTATSSMSGDAELLSVYGSVKEESEETIEFYTNYIKSVSKEKIDKETNNLTTYVMLKDNVCYTLSEENGAKSKIETTILASRAFKTKADLIKAGALGGIVTASTYYALMKSITDNSSGNYSGSKTTLTYALNTYILTITNTEGGENHVGTVKITLKDNYFSSVEVSSKMTLDKKTITSKMSYKFTFGPEEKTYAEAKMPNPAKYA